MGKHEERNMVGARARSIPDQAVPGSYEFNVPIFDISKDICKPSKTSEKGVFYDTSSACTTTKARFSRSPS
ncbi:hypothetical protein KXD40_004010 [Peronospora effusa]|uniref:Uncharacterized protein n=1 Tax=Peronospora effusa TaxID=542832 RepID=A0A3M6VVQ9_9STRA|nr:hypothetical protein DD238_000388 [Peronospora effusa]RQM16623.1 hypothetical protein DD237_001291 [Peronospora effusa]UIZ22909.1 hypothetical protein KXD40_004010 [Peronospora effusa]